MKLLFGNVTSDIINHTK